MSPPRPASDGKSEQHKTDAALDIIERTTKAMEDAKNPADLLRNLLYSNKTTAELIECFEFLAYLGEATGFDCGFCDRWWRRTGSKPTPPGWQ